MEDVKTRLNNLPAAQRARLIQQLQQRQQARPSIWSPLVPLQRCEGEAPIFFVHPAGGALFWYLSLLDHLGEGYNAYGLQGHGIYGDQEPLASIPAMAAAYVPLIRQCQPVGPYQLVGYSIGGAIAFELAQQLERTGGGVSHLVLLDAYLYTERLPFPGNEIADAEERFIARLLGALPAAEQRAVQRHLRSLPDHRTRIDFLYASGRAVGRIPANYTLRDVGRMYETMDAHVQALYDYRPQPYDGTVTFLRCLDRSESDIAPYLPWSTVASGGVRHFDAPGRHSTLLEEPNVQEVARILRTQLVGCDG